MPHTHPEPHKRPQARPVETLPKKVYVDPVLAALMLRYGPTGVEHAVKKAKLLKGGHGAEIARIMAEAPSWNQALGQADAYVKRVKSQKTG